MLSCHILAWATFTLTDTAPKGEEAVLQNLHPNASVLRVGSVACPRDRPATPTDVWVVLTVPTMVALQDLLLVESHSQRLLGTVVEMEVVEARTLDTTRTKSHGSLARTTWAKLAILGTSDGQRRPPDGTLVRRPRPDEVTTLLAEAYRIPEHQRVPVGVIPLQDGVAPVYVHLQRLVGPIATSALITGAAGSLKSTAGVLLLLGIQQMTAGRAALVLVNSKGNDFLFVDYGREAWAARLPIQRLRQHDLAMYSALGYADPPKLDKVVVFVPRSSIPEWCSTRPATFPRTRTFQLGQEVAVRYACERTDDDERPSSVVTRQCIEEAMRPFAHERKLHTLSDIIAALEADFIALTGERARWRNQFQATTVAAALRQLRAAERTLGPILGNNDKLALFPVEELANGGVWVVDIAPLPQRAAQAVLDELVSALWQSKARGVIPHDLPLVLLVDELNRWSSTGPTSTRLAEIVRDQRHRRFSLIGLGQQLSTLHPQLLANADTLWIGNTHARELAGDVYNHLPSHIRSQLHRLPQGRRVLDAWPLVQPLVVKVPFPSWLIADEGLAIVEAWLARQQ